MLGKAVCSAELCVLRDLIAYTGITYVFSAELECVRASPANLLPASRCTNPARKRHLATAMNRYLATACVALVLARASARDATDKPNIVMFFGV